MKGKKLDVVARANAVERRARTLDDWEPYPYEPTEDDVALFNSMAHISPHAPAYLMAFARTGLNTEPADVSGSVIHCLDTGNGRIPTSLP